MWNPWEADDWDRPLDAETTEGMVEAAFFEESEEKRLRAINERVWGLAIAGLFARDGKYIGPGSPKD